MLAGIEAALAAGLKLKINTVALKDDNAGEIPELIAWAHGRGMDMTLIETMPLGEIEQDRTDQYLSLAKVRAELEALLDAGATSRARTGGPARYVRVAETGGRLGFITPLSHNFCEACNRVRLTCTGTLLHCAWARRTPRTCARCCATIRGTTRRCAPRSVAAMTRKPEGHDFKIERYGEKPALARPMSTTGG